MRTAALWICAVWWGSLTTIGFLVVPMLFVHLPSPAAAGAMAAKLFSAQTSVSVVCGVALMMVFRSNRPLAPVNVAQAATIFVVSGVLLALLAEFGVSPRILARDNLVLWHRVGTGMFIVQWLCAGVVFGKLARN
jgi:hypothetical protein